VALARNPHREHRAHFGNGTLTVRADNDGPVGEIMPSLLRLLTVLGVICGLGYGAMYALATFVSPKPREISVTVPPDKFVKRH
jgi:hypothetical protein